MPPRLVFHAGLHKTGTTTCQRWLFPAMRGIVYFGRGGSSALGPTLNENGSATLLYSDETMLGRALDLYATSRRHRCSWAVAHVDALSRLAARFPGAEVILSLRLQPGWILSLYKHYLRYGGTAEFSGFFDIQGDSIVAPDDFLLADRVRGALEAFEGRCHFFWLEDLVARPAATIDGLRRFLGADAVPLGAPPRENEGVGEVEASIVRTLNRIPRIGGSDHWDRKDKLAVALRRWQATPFRIATRLGRLSGDRRNLRMAQDLRLVVERYYEDDLRRLSLLTSLPGGTCAPLPG